MRELPRQVLTERKSFRKLTDKLKNNIRFRWELPIGISFTYEGERKMITSKEQLNRFMSQNVKDFSD